MGASPFAVRLVAAYAVLTVLLNVVVVLPGDPTYSSPWGLLGSVAIQGAVVWRLARGSFVAWLLGLFFALGSVASLFLISPPFDASTLAFAVVCLAQAGVLLAPSVRRFVRSDRAARPVTA